MNDIIEIYHAKKNLESWKTDITITSLPVVVADYVHKTL